nr:ImmA/IrrE family metallo-endopeptidase [bacterium]
QPTWADSLIEFRDAIEHSGALVFFNGIVGNNTSRKLDPGEFRGFVLADEYAPLVFVNNADSKAAQMFTLAHEMAHVIFGSSAAFDLRQMQPAKDATEQACNRAAAEFLVPERELLEAWPSLKNQPDRFHTCARRFKVSEIVVARRALDLNLIRKQEFFDFYNNHKNLMKLVNSKKSSGGDFYNTQNFRLGRRFVSAVARAAKEGKMLYSEAYHLTGLHGKTFDSYVSKTVIGGAW